MSAILFYDTETTDLPDWKSPSDSETQPHLVQLAAILVDEETRETISAIDLIISPDGWTIPEEITEIHGITTEYAYLYGVGEHLALQVFMGMAMSAETRVAHNRTFDQRIIRIAMKRYGYDEVALDTWGTTDNHVCTMLAAKPDMMLEPKNKFGYKTPSLSEAYEHYTGKPLEGAHSAMVDARACMDVYWAMKDKGVIV